MISENFIQMILDFQSSSNRIRFYYACQTNQFNIVIDLTCGLARKAGLIVNDGKELAVQTATSVQKKLEKSNFEVVRVSSSGGMVGFANPDQHMRPLGYTNCVPEGFDSSIEFAIVLGGDGTVLSAARQTAPAKIPILTINTGHLGFLAEAYLSNLDEAIDKIILGNWEIEERTCFIISVMRNEQRRWESLCLLSLIHI